MNTRIPLRLYGLAARALPEPLASLYGPEMRRDFEEIAVAAAARGRLSLWAATVGASWDVVRVGVVERSRRNRLTRWINRWESNWERTMDWVRELRTAARALMRRPGFSTIAVVTLALGIGANVAIFTVVDSVLLEPLPFPESDAIVEVEHHAPGIGLDNLNNSEGTFAMYRDHAEVFSAFGAFDVGSWNLSGDGDPYRVRAAGLSPQMFDVLQVRPAIGRQFVEADAVEDAPEVAILTHGFWKNHYGGDPEILGKTLYLNDTPVEVIGVMPDGFSFPSPRIEMYRAMHESPTPDFGAFGMNGLGRLRPGITLAAAQQHITDLQGRISELYPDIPPQALEGWGWSASVVSYKDQMIGEARSSILIILGTVSLLLLIACANVANLFLVRAEGRQREMAIRGALGAGRPRIAGTYLSESLLLGAVGGGLGLVLAAGGVRGLVALIGTNLPRVHEISIDATALGFTLALSLGVGLLLGLLPMIRHSTRAVGAALRDGGRGSTTGRDRNRMRNVLVSGQLALALILLVGSGLLLRSFSALRSADIGFDGTDVVTLGMSFGDGEREAQAQFYREVVERAAALPGVTSAGAVGSIPLVTSSMNAGSFDIESRPSEEGDLPIVAAYLGFTPGYLETMGIELVAGRPHSWSDLGDGTNVVWVNEAMANEFLGGVEQALTERISFDGNSAQQADESTFSQVVGVVKDIRQAGIQEEIMPMAYFPLLNGEASRGEIEWMGLTVQAPGGPESVVPGLREIIAAVNPRVPITQVRTMEEVRAEATRDTSITLILLGIASSMALLLGAVGLYGVISYTVSQRTQEIGLRMALGADQSRVQGLVLRHSVKVTLVGLGLGLAGAFALSRVMTAMLFEISATDPVTFLTVPIILGTVSLVAAWLPARRASRVDPADALRAD